MRPSRRVQRGFVVGSLVAFGGVVAYWIGVGATRNAVASIVVPVAILVCWMAPGEYLVALTGVYAVAVGFLRGVHPASDVSGNQVLIGAGAVLLALRLSTPDRLERLVWQRYHLWGAAFVVYVMLSATRSLSAEGIATAGRVALGYMFFLIGFILARQGLSGKVDIAVALFSVVASISAAVTRMTEHDVIAAGRIGAVRSGGTVGGAVATAAAVFVGTPVFFKWALGPCQPARVRTMGVFGLVAVAAGVGLTLTRSLVLGLLIFGALMAWGLGRQAGWSIRRLVMTILVPGAVVASGLMAVPDVYLEARFQDVRAAIHGGLEDRTGSGRGGIWRAAVASCGRMRPHEVVFGRGLTALTDAIEKRLGYRKDAHNSYLQLYYDTGVLGLALYGLFVISMLRALRPGGGFAWPKEVWRTYWIAYLLSFLLFNAYVYSGPPGFYSYLGVGAALGVGEWSPASRDGGGDGEGTVHCRRW